MKALCLTILRVRRSRFWWRLRIWFLNSAATRLYLLCHTCKLKWLHQWALPASLRLPRYVNFLISATNKVLELCFVKTSRFATFNTSFLLLFPCSFLVFCLAFLNLDFLFETSFLVLLTFFLHWGFILVCELNHLGLAPLIILLFKMFKFLFIKRYNAFLILHRLAVFNWWVPGNYS